MNYIKQILRKNKGLVITYLAIGLFNAFMVNFKAHFFQKVIDGLTDQTLLLTELIFYGIILLTTFSMNYADEYPGRKLEHGIFLDFKLLALQKISRIDYQEYQKIGTGKLIQRIDNGANAGKGVVFIVTNVLLRFLYQIKEKILNNEEALNRFLVRGFMEMLVLRMARQFPYEMEKASVAKKEIVDCELLGN